MFRITTRIQILDRVIKSNTKIRLWYSIIEKSQLCLILHNLRIGKEFSSKVRPQEQEEVYHSFPLKLNKFHFCHFFCKFKRKQNIQVHMYVYTHIQTFKCPILYIHIHIFLLYILTCIIGKYFTCCHIWEGLN